MRLRSPFGKGLGLSGRLLVLTVLFVTVAEILLYLPALSYYRQSLLNDRISAAHIAALILDAPVKGGLTPEVEMRVLHGVGVKALAFQSKGVRILLAEDMLNPEVSRVVDLRDKSWTRLLLGTLDDLLIGHKGSMRVIGNAPGVEFVEIIMDRKPLHTELLAFSQLFLGYSLFVSLVTAVLLYRALQWIIVSPVLRLARNVTGFAEQPEDTSRIIVPSGRQDEIGAAEGALEGMERSLAGELRKKRRLAELGLAVSKINHELRNILTTAQLLADRLEDVPDTMVQRIAPRLVAVLDRAIAFCEATLAYGGAREREPQRQMIPVSTALEEVGELTEMVPDRQITVEAAIPRDVEVDADPEQLARILSNLVRNSIQALETQPDVNKVITISAERERGKTTILVSDNGPGVPAAIREKLFTPFQSDKNGKGTGLGLVIAAELVSMHGGTVSLDETGQGAQFRIVIPDRAEPASA